jgi:type III restriction enzyme
MKQAVIENPVIDSPFKEPARHFRFSEEGITDEVVEVRRINSYFISVPPAKKKNPKQLSFETELAADAIEENRFINQARGRVACWRQSGYPGLTRATSHLLTYVWSPYIHQAPLFRLERRWAEIS